MSYLIKEMVLEERPRERLKKYGVEALSNEELLSILMRSGTKRKSVKELSNDVLRKIKLHDFAKINYHSLTSINGIGDAKALSILAALEFSKRVLSFSDFNYQIKESYDAYLLCESDLKYELQEKFLAIFLDTRRNVIDKKVIFVGTVNGGNVTPRDVFREAVKCNAAAMIIAHNHPAGSIYPSNDDIVLTKDFIQLGKMMGINVLDHIIVAHDNHYSFRKYNKELF